MIKIADKEIGFGEPTYIIAEAGINHNGDFEIAKQLVDIAVEAKADAVKFQTFKTTELSFKNLTYEEYEKLKVYCDMKNITFLSTPHSLSAIDFLEPLVPAYKIASPFITKRYFVKRVLIKNKPVIFSTGSLKNKNRRATDFEVKQLLSYVNHNKNIALLYCISKYPCYNFDIKEFVEFLETYAIYPIGVSCHSPEIQNSLDAVGAGACIVEKHITIDDSFKCPDKEVSINPEKLKTLVNEIRKIEAQ